MEDGVYLVICLAVLFALIGVVLAGVARLVKRDSMQYDRRFLWRVYDRKDKEEE